MSRVRNFVEPFALSYPFVPEMKKLDPAMADAHGGVSIAAANGVKGLLILMLAYLEQAKNDTLTLYVNGNEEASTTVAAGEEEDDTPLRLDEGLLRKGLNRINIKIERTSGNEETTKDLVLYHRTSPPGDTPPVLNLTVSHKVIGAGEADKFKVTVTYDNAQWYDRIFVFCNGAHFEYQLTPDSVSPLPPVPKSVVIDIPREKLIEGGNDKTFEIKYRVIDYLTNPSGPPTWSDAVFVEVDLDKISLDPPTLVKATSPIDVLNYEAGVTVRAEFENAVAKDRATLKIAGGVPGAPFPELVFNANNRANFTFSVAFLLAQQGKTIQVTWVLIRDGMHVGESPPLELVIGTIAVDDPRLPTPNIAGETGQQLKIQDLPFDAQVLSAKIPLKQQSHPVWVDFEGVDADGKAITKEVWSGDPNESSEGVSVPAQVEWLKTLKDESPLRVLCASNLDGIKDKTKAVLLPVRTYKISVDKALEIDTTPMVLDGFKLLQDYGWATKEVIDNVKLREASGGVPPYTYTSSDDSTASVAANGNVTGLKNGTATVSVMDSVGTALNYSVHINNVYRVKADDRLMTVPEAVSWIRGQGGESYDNFFVPLTVKAIPFNFVDLHIVLRPIPVSIPNGFFRWFGRGEGTAGSYAVFNSASGAFYQGMSTSELRMPPIAFIRT